LRCSLSSSQFWTKERIMLLKEIEHQHPTGYIFSICGSLVSGWVRLAAAAHVASGRRSEHRTTRTNAARVIALSGLIARAAAGAPARRGEGLSCAGHHLLNIIPVRGGWMHNHLLRPATRCERWSCRSAAIAMHTRSNSCGGGPGPGLGLFGITGNTL